MPKPAASDHRGNFRLLTTDGPAEPDAASRIAIQDQLDRALRRLGVEHRTVAVLIHYQGLSADEAADVIGTPWAPSGLGSTTT